MPKSAPRKKDGKPVNQTTSKSLEQRLKADFRVFMIMLWAEMNLPRPTKMQLLFGDILQKSSYRKLCLLGFRGFAKTLIACAYVLWRLYCNPKLQVAFWGSNGDNASDSTQLMLKWIREIPWLQHMAPTGNMDQADSSFDVQGRGIFRGSSVAAFGIGGSITGTRADILVVDDPETSTNGDTIKKRVSIDRAMNEASFVIKEGGLIIVLGTIHFDDSVYTRMMGQGYRVFLFPMAVPSLETQKQCWDYYPEPVKRLIETLPEGAPLDRFGKAEIELKRQTGLLSFERQCLVNPFRTSLSKKPLNMRKLIIFQADHEKLPIRFYHAQDDQWLDAESMNYSSASMVDKLYKPYKFDDIMKPYDKKVLLVDPAGTGKDETAVTTGGAANGYVVVFSSEGLQGGASDENLMRIIETARRYKVDYISVEDNFGQGMFAQLLRAKFFKEYGRFGREDNIIPITTHRQTKKKETRILASLDPVINSGKMVITPDCLRQDYESANEHLTEDKMAYRLTYQLSYFSEAGNQLEFDDRIDNLAELVNQLKPFLADHPEVAAETYEDWLIKKVFSESEQQLQPVPTRKPGQLQSRKSFL